jgi:hypothetical protein
MKRFFLVFLSLLLLFGSAVAEDWDLSTYSYEELLTALDNILYARDLVIDALWKTGDWKVVTVPAGRWIIGQDIPARHWTLKTHSDISGVTFSYFEKLNSYGISPDYSGYCLTLSLLPEVNTDGDYLRSSIDIDMQDGWYFENTGSVDFYPYAGKPDLGFK